MDEHVKLKGTVNRLTTQVERQEQEVVFATPNGSHDQEEDRGSEEGRGEAEARILTRAQRGREEGLQKGSLKQKVKKMSISRP